MAITLAAASDKILNFMDYALPRNSRRMPHGISHWQGFSTSEQQPAMD
jgi:hypothetical protein